jgi:hypothetical protein
MKESRRDNVFYVQTIVTLTLFMTITCSTNDYSKEEKERESKIANTISAMCMKFDADTSWVYTIEQGVAEDYQIYTLHLKTLLLKEDNQPIFFKGSVVDVTEDIDGYYIHFVMHIEWMQSHIEFILRCTQEQAWKVALQPSDRFLLYDDYAVVANISDVDKIRYRINSYQNEYEFTDIEYTELYVGFRNNFIAIGECLEILSIAELRKTL